MKYIASLSFGKDSMAMLIKILQNPQKYPLDEIVFCDVRANKELSGNFDIQEQFIIETIPRIEKMANVPVVVIKAHTTFDEQFFKVKGNKAKFPNTIYGFPMTLQAWCNDRLKMKPLDQYFKQQGEHIRYIGLAADEPRRLARLEKNEIAPLYEMGITEREAKQICKDYNLLSPIYKYFDRDGCWFCPKQSIKSLYTIYTLFPKYWEILKEYQKHSPVPFKPNLTIFDLEERFKKSKGVKV